MALKKRSVVSSTSSAASVTSSGSNRGKSNGSGGGSKKSFLNFRKSKKAPAANVVEDAALPKVPVVAPPPLEEASSGSEDGGEVRAVLPDAEEIESASASQHADAEEEEKDDCSSSSSDSSISEILALADAPTTNIEGSPRSSSQDKDKSGGKIIDMGKISSIVTKRKKQNRIEQPSAKQSAYHGPPRYDWIDIEAAAAAKVQATWRRGKACQELEKQGLTTAAMRNRIRERQCADRSDPAASEDVPTLFRMCGIGLLFGDAQDSDTWEARQAAMEEEIRERHHLQALKEESLRSGKMRPRHSSKIEESLEVVDNI